MTDSTWKTNFSLEKTEADQRGRNSKKIKKKKKKKKQNYLCLNIEPDGYSSTMVNVWLMALTSSADYHAVY